MAFGPGGGLRLTGMRSAPFAFAPFALLGLLGLSACSRAETAADRHMAEMNEAIASIQKDQDKGSKVGKIEVEDKSTLGLPSASSAPPAAKTGTPAPRVVQLGGDDSGESDDPNDPTQRPEIRLVGTPGAGGGTRSSRRGSIRFDDASGADSSSSSAAGSGRPSALDPEARRAYDQALALVNAKQHERALEALNAFLVRWPDHPYAENAMYWRGEIYFAEAQYLRAAEQFEAVVARFGGGRKAPDALLKIGMCHDRLGAPSRANEYWTRLKRDYPQSDAARKIPSSKEPR